MSAAAFYTEKLAGFFFMIGDMVFLDKEEDVTGGEPREGGFAEVAVA